MPLLVDLNLLRPRLAQGTTDKTYPEFLFFACVHAEVDFPLH